MAASLAKFCFGFVIVSIILWMIFIFCSRLFLWILGASVKFHVSGLKCLRDVMVKFEKGAIESVSVGEIKLSLRQSKMQVLICVLEVVMRSTTSTTNLQNSKIQKKSRTSGRGKWIVVANIARFLSVSITDIVVKTPMMIVEVKELKLDISEDGGTKPNLYVKLNVLPILVHLSESRMISDHSSNLSFERCSASQASSTSPDRLSAALFCDELSISTEFGHDRAVGIVLRNVEVISGDVVLNIDEDSFPKSKQSSAAVYSDEVRTPSTAVSSAKKPHKEHQLLASLGKYSLSFPEKVSFSLPKLDVRCVNREHDLLAENNITGIQLRIVKSRSVEDTRESTRLDVQLELSEIHIFREPESSMLEIMKVDVVSFIYIPLQPVLPVSAEVDIKLEGTRCNLFISKLHPWFRLHFLKKRKLVLQGGTHTVKKSKAADVKAVMWTCAVSAPEITVMLYGIDDFPVYHFSWQSSHVFANDISSMGTKIHVELGELNLYLTDDYQECFKENLNGIEPNSGLLMHIAKVSLDWGRRDGTSSDEVGGRSQLVLSVDVSGMGIYFSFKRVESLITNAMSFEALFKTLSVAGKKMVKTGGVQLSKASGKGTRLVNLNLERCCLTFCDDTGLDNTVIDDSKSVNNGSQGGRVAVSSLADGTPRTASLLSYGSAECKRLKYSVSLEISQFSFCLNNALHSIQLEFVRAKSIYQEYMEEHKPCSKVTLFDMHNVKFERRSSSSLFSATDISLSWEPDAHLSFYELFLRLRSLVYAQKLKDGDSGCNKDISSVKDVNEQRKMEYIFAIDVEMLTISAKVEDEVEIKLEVKSIFSENVSVGVLLEGIILAFNGSRVFKSKRMQISRILGKIGDPWDWVVQGIDVHICLPYKLQLCAIADSIDEMLRGLRLITTEKEENIFPGKAESSKPKESSPNIGCIRFCMRKITADIEEEPMQGWLDEHYQLMKKEACELAVRLNFLHKETSDPLAINKATEQIHKRSFQSYYKACKDLVPSEGSGACREGIQAGFKPSAARTSLLSVCATDLDLSLTAVHENDAGLMEVLRKLDPICQENDITFSRLNGSNVCLKTGSLTVQLRNYTLPLFSGTIGICDGRIVQLKAHQGDEEKCKSSGQPQNSQDVFVGKWRKVKMFQSASDTTQAVKTHSDLRIQFEKGVVSFGVGYEPAFADISYAISVALGAPQVIEEEQSLPWWDNMRNNVHGNISLSFSESKWTVLATTDPYESRDKLQIVTGPIEFQQSDGRVIVNAKDFKIKLSSLESLISRYSLKVPDGTSGASFFEAPVFTLEVKMDWCCESENALNVYDRFRSTSLSLQCNISLRPKKERIASPSPTMNLGAQDLVWILKFCGMNCDPPHKLRSFSRWPRFGVPRVAIPESLSLDQVMTEHMLRVDVTPYIIKYMTWDVDDPARGLTFSMKKVKYELCFSRGKQKYTFECKRDALDLVYQSLDLCVVKAFINKDEHHHIEGFLLSSDYLTIRRQAPKAEHERLLAWQEAGRRNLENGSECDEHIRSDSRDDVDNVVTADNCQRVFVYGLKLRWTIQNRDAVRSFVGGMLKAFEPPQPSPSRQYTQMKIREENQKESCQEMHQGGISRSSQPVEKSYDRVGKVETREPEEEGTQHFMVNVIEPQFNLHSEEVNGCFLLAANCGRVLARSFHSIMRVGVEVIEQTLGIGTESVQIPECSPEMTWKRMEFSIMLEHVEAHVAPTDVYQGDRLQWLPKYHRNHPKVKGTRALLESVFMPCDMYLRYTRHKSGTPDLKVKPLKEITFNSPNMTATMTSRQFQIMMDVLTNLLFARLPKPRKSSLQCFTEDEDLEEEADEVVPYGVEEVEFAKINLEENERERNLLLDDIRKWSHCSENMNDSNMETEGELWMISSRRSILVQELKKELIYAQKSRKAASAYLRMALHKAAQLQLMEKEKNKSPSYAMSISLQINEVVWSMLEAGKPFAEAEIHDMIYDFDRDYKDIGVTRFTTKYFVVRNCLPDAKSDKLLSAWNPPAEWGKKLMLRVDSKQGAPKDGNYPFELFHVEIYPLRIHLTERMYTMMWDYFFPDEEYDLPRQQDVWKINDVEPSQASFAAVSASALMQSQRNDECIQKSNTLDLKSSTSGVAQKLRRTSSFDKTWEKSVAKSVANEFILSSCIKQQGDSSKQKPKKKKPVVKSHEEKKKTGKSRPRKKMKFHNIRISQVELLITYEGSRLNVNNRKLLMDTLHYAEFTGTWGRLFSRVKKHIIWGLVKSVTGMQMMKFKDFQKKKLKDKSTDNDLNLSGNDQLDRLDQQQVTGFKRQSDGAGDRFVTCIRGVFNTQAVNDIDGQWSHSDVESSPFASELTITKAKRLIRCHTKKLRSRSQRGSTSQQRASLPSSSQEITAFESHDSSGSSSYEEF